jgi:hypothetical protein
VTSPDNPLRPCSSLKPKLSNQRGVQSKYRMEWGPNMKISKPSILVLSLFVSIIVASVTGSSQQLSVLGGPIFNDRDNTSGSVMAEYSQKIQGPFSFSVSYLNEGHFDGHHRDGFIGQGWIGTNLSEKFSLRLGVGPYLYFDTTWGQRNSHGIGEITSLDLQWSLSNRWVLDLRSSYILTSKMNTIPILVGLGYKFNSSDINTKQTLDRNELCVLLGISIVNNPGESNGFAKSIEYRRNLWSHVDLTISYLHEGENDIAKRQGVATQLWATQKLSDHISIGIGGGLYEAHDKFRDSNLNTNGIVSLTGSYRIYNNWLIRISWNRIITSYDKDSDVVLVGLGYKF